MADKQATKDDSRLEQILEKGIDCKNRRLYFGNWSDVPDDEDAGDFGWLSVEKIIRKYHYLVDESPNKAIEIHIMSPGGDSYALTRLINEIEHGPCKMIFIGGGSLCSSAAFLMAACDECRVFEDTEIMFHHGGAGFSGTMTEANISMDQYNRVHETMIRRLADNSNLDYNAWMDLLQVDVFMTAQEALSLGLVDKILKPKKRTMQRKVRSSVQYSNFDEDEIKQVTKDLYKRTKRKRNIKIEVQAPIQPPLTVEELIKSTGDVCICNDLTAPCNACLTKHNGETYGAITHGLCGKCHMTNVLDSNGNCVKCNK